METTLNTSSSDSGASNLSTDVRSYFLNQGQKISQLYQMLDRGYYKAYLSRAIYWIVEIALYLLFAIALYVIISIPTDISQHIKLDDSNSMDVKFTNEEVAQFITLFKFIFFILSLMPLILARVIRNARKKTQAIQASFKLVEEMKTDFDKALKDLKL